MATPKPVCIFCNSKKEKIIHFTKERLEKCAEILVIRELHNLQGKNVKLPSALSDTQGYHSKCLSNFTALKAKYRKSDDQSVSTSCKQSLSQPSTSGITQKTMEEIDVPEDPVIESDTSTCDESFPATEDSCDNLDTEKDFKDPKVCIFCNSVRKKHSGRWQQLHSSCSQDFRQKMQSQATELNDVDLLMKIEDISSEGCPISYHRMCLVQFQNKFHSLIASQKEKTDWHLIRDTTSAAFDKVCSFVQENIIRNKHVYYLDFLRTLYTSYLSEEVKESKISPDTFCTRYLEERLLKMYPKSISIIQNNKRKVVKPYSGVVLKDSDFSTLQDADIVQKAALILRRSIREIKKKQMPEKISASDLINGECEVPNILTDFYNTILSGGAYRRRKSHQCERFSKSFSEDVIHRVWNGKILPSKHIVLGLTLKGLTNSKKIVNILNRYGHCSSYTTLQELETEATFSSSNQLDVCPEDIIRAPNLCTGLAFNNFDRFVDTASGKDTLHDTVGIIFQNIDDNIDTNESATETEREMNENVESSSRKKRRRTFDTITHDMEAYTKKPKITETLLPLHITSQISLPMNLEIAQQIDTVWMLSHALQMKDMPMWVGYNSLLYNDKSTRQKISYLTTINESPTSDKVVLETLKQCQKVAEECREKYMQVTYDLGIANKALKIQSDKKPLFDNLFIHIGPFHIMMAYFKAIGKFIDNCGLTNIMVDTELLASGSVNSFITGKHFNRCKRLHPLMSLAIQIMHYESFVKITNLEITDDIKQYLENFKNERFENPVINNEHLLRIIEKYEEYEKSTLAGDYGKTSQFYLTYSNLVHYYLLFNRSIRTADFDLLRFVLPKITNLFFTFNQQNYSRYLVKYWDNLQKVDVTHPGLKEQFEKGSIGIRRTSKPFSRQPVDLVLEQTINADAANKLTGIIQSTNSISARQRWCKSHSIRARIITHVMETTGLRNRQDITADLRKSSIKKSTDQLKKFITNIRANMDPFSSTVNRDYLYNISSGKAAKDNVAEFLLNVEKIGEEQREKFITECAEDETRFEKVIKRNKVYSFTESQMKKITISGKVVEVRMQRDLFGRLLAISLQQSLNLEKILEYPLMPVPLSLCHIDGTMCKTDKSALLKLLENKIDTESPSHIDVQIFDGFFMLHLMRDIPVSFGNISKKILQMFTRTTARTVIITFDQYFSPSIKDNEHTLRGTSRNEHYRITGGEQTRPADFSTALKDINFKEALVKFICEDWRNPTIAPFIKNKIIYVNYETCYKYEELNGIVRRTEEATLACPAHEESDTKVIFHACKVEQDSNVVIRCSDTDILIIALGNMQFVNENVKIWLKVGVGNNERYINVNKLHESLGRDLCRALPAFHALTGCDFNPAFFKKGKKRPFTTLQNSPQYITTFSNMHNYPESDGNEIFDTLEKFICELYGYRTMSDVNEVRLAAFMKAYKCNDTQDQLQLQSTSFDGSILPPCKVELRQQILRAIYISSVWCNAHFEHPTLLSPSDYGWKEVNNKLEFLWFEGDQLPTSIEDIVINKIAETDNIESDVVNDGHDSDTMEPIQGDNDSSDSEDSETEDVSNFVETVYEYIDEDSCL